MGKRKYKITDELEGKYSCFRNGRQEWEAKRLVCEAETYLSVADKGALDL
jgi:hypothetical protein